MEALDLRGLVPAPVTPFTRDGEVDHAAIQRLGSWLGSFEGVKGLVVLGHAGEGTFLSPDEQTAVMPKDEVKKGKSRPAPPKLAKGEAAEKTEETLSLADAGLLGMAPLAGFGIGGLAGGILVDFIYHRTGSKYLSRSGTAAAALTVAGSTPNDARVGTGTRGVAAGW